MKTSFLRLIVAQFLVIYDSLQPFAFLILKLYNVISYARIFVTVFQKQSVRYYHYYYYYDYDYYDYYYYDYYDDYDYYDCLKSSFASSKNHQDPTNAQIVQRKVTILLIL